MKDIQSNPAEIKAIAETLKTLADVLESYEKIAEIPQESAYQQARPRKI